MVVLMLLLLMMLMLMLMLVLVLVLVLPLMIAKDCWEVILQMWDYDRKSRLIPLDYPI